MSLHIPYYYYQIIAFDLIMFLKKNVLYNLGNFQLRSYIYASRMLNKKNPNGYYTLTRVK